MLCYGGESGYETLTVCGWMNECGIIGIWGIWGIFAKKKYCIFDGITELQLFGAKGNETITSVLYTILFSSHKLLSAFVKKLKLISCGFIFVSLKFPSDHQIKKVYVNLKKKSETFWFSSDRQHWNCWLLKFTCPHVLLFF